MLRRKCRPNDNEYSVARFCHIVCDFFDQNYAGSLSVGICPPPINSNTMKDTWGSYDLFDNGIYIIKKWGLNGKDAEIRRIKLIITKTLNPKATTFDPYDYEENICELSNEEIKKEIKEAYEHEYNKDENSIAKKFKKLRPKVGGDK